MKHIVTFDVLVDSGDRLLSTEEAQRLCRAHLANNYAHEVEREHTVPGPYVAKPDGHEGEWDTHPDDFKATTSEQRVETVVVREVVVD